MNRVRELGFQGALVAPGKDRAVSNLDWSSDVAILSRVSNRNLGRGRVCIASYWRTTRSFRQPPNYFSISSDAVILSLLFLSGP